MSQFVLRGLGPWMSACERSQTQWTFDQAKSDREVGDVTVGDLPLRDMVGTGGKVEQFADVNLNVSLDPTQTFWDNTIYCLCAQAKFLELPPPFCLKSGPNVPYSMHADHCHHPIHHSTS